MVQKVTIRNISQHNILQTIT